MSYETPDGWLSCTERKRHLLWSCYSFTEFQFTLFHDLAISHTLTLAVTSQCFPVLTRTSCAWEWASASLWATQQNFTAAIQPELSPSLLYEWETPGHMQELQCVWAVLQVWVLWQAGLEQNWKGHGEPAVKESKWLWCGAFEGEKKNGIQLM